ncbi:MAG: DUF5615 family PIN-like protein [Armatimonadetes bacterium]|nr:DUF5615 family PIN-like protein [Armatimonadota bacterium]MDW8029896.1 DUF5615 family PIN-like protein [Armatimonadota bacterium]
MSFTIYLDDCLDDDHLIALLRQEGFVVISPRKVGTIGLSDEEHLNYCARNGYAILTADADDFSDLHENWRSKGLHHAGIIVICRERDVRKHMTNRKIARALKNLLEACEKSEVPIVNEFIVLNQWR